MLWRAPQNFNHTHLKPPLYPKAYTTYGSKISVTEIYAFGRRTSILDAVTALGTYTSKASTLPNQSWTPPKLATLATCKLPQPSTATLFPCNALRPWLWPWMDTATFTSSLTTTQRRSSLGHSTRGAQLRRRKWNNHVGSINLEFSILLLMQVLVLAANMASLAVAMPMAGREPVGCGAQEGLWSQVKCQVSSWSGVQGGRGGLRLAQAEDVQLRMSLRSSGKASAVTTCGLAYEGNGENGELGKVGHGAESGIQPIQFENGQDPPTVVYAPNRRIVAGTC
jgi:hypothetical protein